MIRLATIVFLFLWPAVAAAQTVQVRSGEHNGFSRLVIYLPASVEWTLRKAEDNGDYIFNAERGSVNFDMSRVFDLIPRDRLSSYTVDGNTLRLRLGCDCEILSQRLSGGQVVLDITQASRPIEELTDPPNPIELPDFRSARRFELPLSTSRVDIAPPLDEVDEDRDAALEDFRRGLIEQLSRATTQALLDIPSQDFGQPQDTTDETPAEDQSDPEIATTQEVPDRVVVSNAIDNAIPEPLQRLSDTPVGCYEGEDFEIADWGDDRPFPAQASALRERLTGEFDAIDQSAVLALVRLHLFFGLGAEARNIIDVFKLTSDSAKSAIKISRLVDGDQLPPDDPLRSMTSCSPEVAMWSILAGTTETLNEERIEKITSSFMDLTPDLRKMLGPKLIAGLNAAEETVAARVISASLDRAVNPTDLIRSTGDAGEVSEDELRDKVTANTAESPAALAELLSSKLARGERPTDAEIELAASFAYELEGLPIAQSLTTLEIRSLSLDGSFDAAFAAFKARAPEAEREGLFNQIVDDLMRFGSDDKKVAAALVLLEDEDAMLLSVASQTGLANALLDLSLPALAERVLSMGDGAPESETILADALAKQRRFEEAVSQLISEDQPGAVEQRAEYLLRAGQAENAWRDHATGLTEEETRSRFAWAAGAWDEVSQNEQMRTIASSISVPLPSSDTEAPLEAATQDVERSAAVREAVEALLSPSQSTE